MTTVLNDEGLDGSTVETLLAAPTETPDPPPTETPGTGAGAPSAEGHPDLKALFDTVGERRATVDRAEADVLALVVELADACPAETDGLLAEAADGPWGGVAETAVVELGARLGMSHGAAGCLLTEAVELRDRLPRLWALVQTGRLQAWKARRVAAVTTSLSAAVVEFIDVHAAVAAGRNRLPDLRKLVVLAINRCDPDLAEGLEEAAGAHRDVKFEFSASTDAAATARVEATLDLLDALDLDATITDLAASMGRLGDDSPIGVRRARALGALANPQRTLDLFGDPVTPTLDPTAAGRAASPATDVDGSAAHSGSADAFTVPQPRGPRRPWHGQREWNSQVGHVYLHLDAADLRALLTDNLLTDSLATDGLVSGGAGSGGVDLERLGAASLHLVRAWLGRVTRVSVRPVLDLAAVDAVDAHDPPPAMRDHVILRDGRCMFPGCGIHARACDVDHIDPYVPMDLGGPPGQTRPANLACLCRRHHRMKTHHGWDYHRTRDGDYAWTDPRDVGYTTTPAPLHHSRPDRR